jgi:5'-nucleotidase
LRILVSNDDGYFAPGLAALAEAMRAFGEVVVVAPERNRSGASNSLTLDRPLNVSLQGNGFHAVSGTPTDCVHIALTGLSGAPFDLVVSGINSGPNMGDDTIYSGTVAAAMEAYLFGVPAIAFSLADYGGEYLSDAATAAQRVVEQFLQRKERDAVLLNVNIPARHQLSDAPLRVTRLGKRHTSEPVLAGKNPRGDAIYWIGPPGAAQDASDGTDFYALANGHISITPLQVDLTAKSQLDTVSNWFSAP